jgi:septal ring factor EnvC (AmiA/AmiB activator)
MKIVTLKLKGWRNRPEPERAAIETEIANLDSENRKIWKQIEALWAESREQNQRIRTLRRKRRAWVRGECEVKVEFDGHNPGRVDSRGDYRGRLTNEQIIARAWEQLKTTP